MVRGSLVVAMLMCCACALSAQTVNVTVLEKNRTTTTFTAHSTESTTGQPGRHALPVPDPPSGSGTLAAPHTYTVTGASLRLQLPDGRILEAVCTDRMADQLSSQPRHSCMTPAEGPLQAKFKGANVKLTWRVAKKKRSEVYSVLHLPLTAALPPHR